MPSFATITAALALTSAVAANPVNLRKREFTVEQVPRGIFAKNGPATIAKTLRKYGKPVPENILKAAAKGPQKADVEAAAAASGSAPASPSDPYDSSYLTPVTVGSSTLHLDFDTGSADLWCFSSLQSSAQTSGHDIYRVDSSKAKSGYTWRISYGDGSGASGRVYADKVVVGGVTATSQAVEAATSVSAEFAESQDTDGLLGLAFSSINTVSPQPQKTFFDTVRTQLSQPLFAADLKYHTAGTYDFGFIDSSKYTGSITYGPVDNSQGFWGTTMDGYAVGSGRTVSSPIDGIADTGTTLLYLPSAVVRAYYAQVPGAQNSNEYGGYVFDCDAALPDFTLIFQGVKQTVPGKYINYSPIQTGSSSCFGGIQSNEGVGLSIFGDIFLKSKYVIFEMASSSSPRIGFANQ